MKRVQSKNVHKKWNEFSDDQWDKKHGIKEGSPQDVALDKKRGLKDDK